MKIFLKHLKEEHDVITKILSRIEHHLLDLAAITHEQIPILQDLILFSESFIQNVHHKKEEELLFPKIDMSPIVYQGGPFCTHYYQFHIEYQRLEQSHELARLTGADLSDPIYSPNVRQMIEHRNALMVPLEDHWACHNYMAILKKLISTLETKTPIDPVLIRRCLIGFIALINQHTEKENNCLFVMANELLDAKIQEELFQKALAEFPYDRQQLQYFQERLLV